MGEIIKLDNFYQYNIMRGASTLHPLVTVLDLSTTQLTPSNTFNFGLYTIVLKEFKCGEIKYGRNH